MRTEHYEMYRRCVVCCTRMFPRELAGQVVRVRWCMKCHHNPTLPIPDYEWEFNDA